MNNLRGRVKYVSIGDARTEYDTLGRISYMVPDPSQSSIVFVWSGDNTMLNMGFKSPYTNEIISSSHAYVEVDLPELFVYYYGDTRLSFYFDILGRVQRISRENRLPGGFIGVTEQVYSYDGDSFSTLSIYDSSSQSTSQVKALEVDSWGNPILVKQIMPDGTENIFSQSIEYYD